jgi:hypothetical protein
VVASSLKSAPNRGKLWHINGQNCLQV